MLNNTLPNDPPNNALISLLSSLIIATVSLQYLVIPYLCSRMSIFLMNF